MVRRRGHKCETSKDAKPSWMPKNFLADKYECKYAQSACSPWVFCNCKFALREGEDVWPLHTMGGFVYVAEGSCSITMVNVSMRFYFLVDTKVGGQKVVWREYANR